MKATDIVVGGIYRSKGSKQLIRKVIAEGEFKLFPNQTDTDCVRYEVLFDGIEHPQATFKKECTRKAFASWANERFYIGEEGAQP